MALSAQVKTTRNITMEKVRMFSYLLSRLTDAMNEQEYVLPRWTENDQNKKKNMPLKEVVVVKPFTKIEFFQNPDKFNFMGRKASINR